MSAPIVLEGDLAMILHDCGYAHGSIFVGDRALDEVLWTARCEARGTPNNPMCDECEDYGRVRLTIEFLGKGP